MMGYPNTHASTKSYNNCMVEERDNVVMIEIVHTDDICTRRLSC